MKKSEIKFAVPNGEFLYRCIFDGSLCLEEEKKLIEKMYRSSNSTLEFIEKFLNEKRFENTQAYAELAKAYDENFWYRIRENLGDRVFKTWSDVGGVKVGNSDCSFIVPNGHGDGETRVAIVEKDDWNSTYLRFFTSVQGEEINIYTHDCGNYVDRTINGRFGIYGGEGFVVFEKWD